VADLIRKVAIEAGICWDWEHVEAMDRIGGRGILANPESMYKFAKLIGQMARADERRKYERSNEATGSDHGG
jgi:hypothetical protein